MQSLYDLDEGCRSTIIAMSSSQRMSRVWPWGAG